MAGSPAIDVRGVWKRYSRSAGWVLRDVDLTIDAGTLVVVLGGNGDGKSTLLRIVAGVSSMTKGHVRGRPETVSYLPERLPADLRMTAARYLKHMAGLRGRRAAMTLDRSMELLDLFKIAPGPDVPMARLSKGNRQKVSLAQAFGPCAGLTVLDEPFGGLDQETTHALTTLFADAKSEGRSLLVSAHSQVLPEQSDAVLQLGGGRLQVVQPALIGDRQRDEAGLNDQLVRLVLRAADPAADRASLAGLDGVRSVQDDSFGAQLVIVTSDPDAVLRSALNCGWSFVRGDLALVETRTAK